MSFGHRPSSPCNDWRNGLSLLAQFIDPQRNTNRILATVLNWPKKNWPLIDLKDLVESLKEVYDHASDYSAQYGNIKQSVGAIQWSLLVQSKRQTDLLESLPWIFKILCTGQQWMRLHQHSISDSSFNSLSSIQLSDLVVVSVCSRPYRSWMIQKLKFCLLLDEAHLLFNDASKALPWKVTSRSPYPF